MNADGVIAAIGRSLERDVVSASAVHGGDTAVAYRLGLADGTHVFAKTHASPPPGFFTTEAWGLRWMGEAHGVRVPTVLAVSDDPAFLVLEWIDEGRRRDSTEASLGHELAALHLAGAPSFGRADGRTTGSLGLPNEPCDTWAEFYGARRLVPLAAIARSRRSLPETTIAKLESLADRLDRFDDGRPPARLHGDLWAGNRLVDTVGSNWFVDPACHGGHAEFDLAMMRLFGGFGPEAFETYAADAPLTDGWEGRVELHQIAPLVVHAIKFGGGYVRSATAAIDRYS